MKIKTLALVLCALFCVGLSSCKDDGRQDLPKLSTSGVNSEDTGSSAKYTGPMTELQVSMTATYPAASKSRAFNTSFKQGSSDENLMQINWEKDKKYKLRVCVRPNTDNNGWDAEAGPYADFTGTVISVSGETYTKDGKQYGTGGTLWIEGSIKVPTKYLTANNIYFAAFIYTDADNVQVDPKGPITFPLPKMIAVHNPQNNTTNTAPATIPTMSVLTAIPFTHVTFVKKGSDYKMVKADASGHEDTANKTYNIKPILTLFHFKVTNKMNRLIRFPEAQEFSFPKSTVAFGVGIKFDFWKFSGQLNTFGQDNFFFHFGKIVTDKQGNTADPVTTKDYSVGVDYSNIPDNLQSTDKKYIKLKPNSSLDFYVAGTPVLTPTDANHSPKPQPKFDVDFSSLGFQYQAKDGTWVDCRKTYSTLYAYSDGKDNDGNTVSDKSKSLKEDINPLYFSAKHAAADNYKQGGSYYKSFDVSSDLMIDLIGYRWDGVSGDDQGQHPPTKAHGDNYSLVQLYNATSSNVDLQQYYLVRTIYNYPSNGDVLFCSNGWDFTPNLGYAVLCPIVPSGQKLAKEISPLGYDQKKVMFRKDNNDQTTDDYHAFYAPGPSPIYRYTNIVSGAVAIIGAAGFQKPGQLTIDNIRAQYTTSQGANYAKSDNNWGDSYGGVQCIFAIRDGKFDSEHANPRDNKDVPGNEELDCYERVPGNPWSSVMSRGNGSGQYQALGDTNGGNQTIGAQTINGWALVKRIDKNGRHKFIIVDTFGPCPIGNDDASHCSEFLSGFGTNDYSPFVFFRNPEICQPYGAQMNLTNPKSNPTDSNTTQGWQKYVSWSSTGYGYGPMTKPMIGVINR